MEKEDVLLLARAIGEGCERIAEAIETSFAGRISEDQSLGEYIYHGLITAAKYIAGETE